MRGEKEKEKELKSDPLWGDQVPFRKVYKVHNKELYWLSKDA